MSIIGNVEILVTPEELAKSAGIVEGYLSNMQDYFDKIEETVRKTSSYWVGDAADFHRDMYMEQQENIIEIMARLNEHPRDLLSMAGIYSRTENEVEAIALELPGNAIG